MLKKSENLTTFPKLLNVNPFLDLSTAKANPKKATLLD